ncbi:MAG: phosphopantothenoylcysteine decarboxylase / phosphopantothenate---cysteine ligase, partial [Thermoplasmata archaeon]|nr:phosphopantothenoylcysteine decarboxylase / phosphopantothenate---cysteine ligase [Thermoplasmata archaeon]
MQPEGLGTHPVENIRGSLSHHLEGRRIVLAVCGSIAAVKAVELARELIRHGADVVPVMSASATRILHPDALHFATGHQPIVRLTGAVEHVSLLGDVPGKADLLLVAPATANTVSKMA